MVKVLLNDRGLVKKRQRFCQRVDVTSMKTIKITTQKQLRLWDYLNHSENKGKLNHKFKS
jgi:hypothetical protein